jgi:hypothetical protein
MKHLWLFLVILILAATACKKEAGEGGTSSISGKVWVLDYNSEYTQLNSQFYGIKEDVYIIYGNGNVYDKSFKTSYDGSYRFEHLTKGKYKLFCYSEDTTALVPGGIFPVIKEVEITANGQDLQLDDFIIVK